MQRFAGGVLGTRKKVLKVSSTVAPPAAGLARFDRAVQAAL